MSNMIAKVCLLISLAVAAQAVAHGGSSTNFRKQDDHGNYAFGYQIVDHHGNTNGRQEAGHGGHHVHGSYNLALHDGRVRKVEYVADKHGFRAAIKTNEPGTQHSLPAAVDMDSPYKGFAAGSYGISHGGYGGNDGGYGRGNGAGNGYGAGRGNGGYGGHY
ncbi:hypothetical protein LAZ67_23000248 [Cordylochernes scorpioides]|uniref:Adult-specific rigid cuticular protein 15.7 n=1 Tax=Cordylochernes scorpioides TaxID=51811 RepID=A0ABY6LPU1_9ARAC|nr:hypothetical protein LAZ67_23000248 [Cordylochernes scorpioides]